MKWMRRSEAALLLFIFERQRKSHEKRIGLMNKIKVLVVDDSSFMRKIITDIIHSDPDLQVVDTAKNGQEAIDKNQGTQT